MDEMQTKSAASGVLRDPQSGSAYDTAISGVGIAAGPSGVVTELQEQGSALEHLGAAISQLEDRIGPVLKQEITEDGDELARARPANASPVVEQITSYTTQLWRMKERIHRLIERADF